MEEWEFCPDRMVVHTKPDAYGATSVSMNGWHFAARPNVPFQRMFVAKLHGLQWHLIEDDPESEDYGKFDELVDLPFNARLLEKFYARHGVWKPFIFPHPHFGPLEVRFQEPVEVPPGIENSGGLIEAIQVTLVEHNPGYDNG